MADLDARGRVVELARGVRLRTPGLRGTAELLPAATGSDVRAPESGVASEALATALDETGFRPFRSIRVLASPAPGVAGQRGGAASGLVVEVPAAGPDYTPVLLYTDEYGVKSWHLPVAGRPSVAGGDVRFLVSGADVVEPVPGGRDRGLAGVVARKLLSVLLIPLTEYVLGEAAGPVARQLEKRVRPYFLRHFGPDDYRLPRVAQVEGGDWERLRHGRVLLFLHGTFSTSHGGFHGLEKEVLGALAARYDGVLAFDHPTLGTDPAENAEELLNRLPPDLDAEIDVITHSRGGLVARALIDKTDDRTAPLQVKRVVFAATPNAGTALADAKHVASLLDRYTTLLDLIPDGPWSPVVDTLSGVVTAVQVIGRGAVGGLPGLVVMQPGNPWLDHLGDGRTRAVEYGAVDADFEPTGGLWRLSRLGDAAADRVFGKEPNDMVVPSSGVGTAPGRFGFPVDPARQRHFTTRQGVWHCSLFSRDEMAESLTAWCTGRLK